MSEERKEAKKPEEEFIDAYEYEKFCDALTMNFKKGMFVLMFGSSTDKPIKLTAKIFVDSFMLKDFSNFIKDQIKEYEKKYGEIK